MQNMKFISQIVFEVLKTKKSCKPIGLVHFCLQLQNQIFDIHTAFDGIVKGIIVQHLTLLWTNFFLKSILLICFRACLGMLDETQQKLNDSF